MRRTKLTILIAVGCVFAATSVAQAAGPTAVATDSDGVVYAGFENGGQIKRYSGSDGSFLGAWGTAGSGAGQIGGVVALDVAPTGSGGNAGNVWVLDTNRRVQEFTRSGTFIRGFQLNACGAGITPNPTNRGGLDVALNDIYVAHPCRNQVFRYARSNLSQQAAVSVNQPKGVSAQLYGTAPGSTQAVYVARPATSQVAKLNLTTLASLGNQATYAAPSDVFVDAFGTLFVSVTNDNGTGERIYLYDQNGSEFRWLGGAGSDAGRVIDPLAFDVYEQFSDLAGNVFVADYGNQRLQRWNSFGFTFWAVPATDSVVPPSNPPQNTALPQIQGSPVENNVVTCTQGTWNNNPTQFDFQWNRNGNPIAGETGNQYTIASADVGQNLTCTVTATNADGSNSATSAAVVPTGAPPASGPVGISVNSAAIFTNSTTVTLTIHEPAGATNVHISNDGGFAAPDTRPIFGSDTYAWSLVSSGADRLPKSVYVRFTGPGIDGTQTYSDDIILDEAPPSTFAATMTKSTTRGKAKWTLKVRAEDENSGLAELQTARSPAEGFTSQPFSSRTVTTKPHLNRFVRVTDKAGNVADAVKVKVKRKKR